MSDSVLKKGQPNKAILGCIIAALIFFLIVFTVIALIAVGMFSSKKNSPAETEVRRSKIIEMTIYGSGKKNAIEFRANGRPFRAAAPNLKGRIYWEALDHSGKVVFGPVLVAVGVEQPEETFQDQANWITMKYWIIDGASSQTLQFQFLD